MQTFITFLNKLFHPTDKNQKKQSKAKERPKGIQSNIRLLISPSSLEGTPSTKQSSEDINLFIELLEKHRDFFEELERQYYLDYWTIQSTFVLLENNHLDQKSDKFSVNNLCSALLLVWDYFEDDYSLPDRVYRYFGKVLYPSLTKAAQKKNISKAKTVFFVSNLSCQIVVPKIEIEYIKKELNIHFVLGERSAYEMSCLSSNLLS
ncbi:hypothetical protein EIN_468460 [Entamoeba invadens IP1]|uniref:Uncharacterized protein n=1 Tax=Entamoeba invadens IP1 TaxID=370355 RepID=A0A0A1TUH4_ENTIV|nr:hypothetical protein EIN_468460 [Entamoeba invadens IP1]ELP83702.1 hypothetical protein EIN_468460 [Entamoeba invadens IP1]|eukprot:XP_004183048.1 hypothetical protein EIN_468460 [Entamoeba invadens IP1]